MAVKARKSTLTAEEVRKRLHYDPETGVFRWIRTRGALAHGSIAGFDHLGYRRIKFGPYSYMAARMAWLLYYGEWPPEDKEIDHINLVRNDNRIANLRLANHGQNMANRLTQREGLKGASLHNNRWRVRVSRNGKNHLIGTFDTEEEAHAAYVEAAARIHGEFVRA